MEKSSVRNEPGQAAVDLERFFALSIDMLCIAGFDGYFKHVNDAWERTLGWTMEEMTSHPWAFFVHPDDLQNTVDEAAKQTESGLEAVSFENRYRAKDGSYHWLQWHSRPSAEHQEMHAIARDITNEKTRELALKDLNKGLERKVEERTRAAEARALRSERAERRLRDSETQAKAVLMSAVDSMITIDEDGTIESVNPATERVFGYAAEEMIGHNVSLLMPQPDRERHDSYLENYRRTGERKIIGIGRDVVGRRKDGTTFPAELAVSEVLLGDRRIFSGMVRDVSERRNAERALRDSEAQAEAVLMSAVDSMITIDEDGTIESVNPATERVFGYTAAEMIGHNVSLLMPSPDHERHDSYLENYRRTGERKIIGIGRDVVGRRKDGTTFPAELAVSEVLLGDRRIFSGMVRDISERKEAERALRDSEAQAEAVLMSAVDSMITIDEDGTIESINPATERVFGYAAEEMIGHNVSLLMPQPDHERHDSYLENYRRTGERKIIGIGRDVVGRRKDGTTFPAELAVSEVVLGDRRIFSGMVRDVSERRNAERALQATSDNLRRTNTELEALVHSVSHDLQEPLRTLDAFSQFLMKEYDERLDDEGKDYLKRLSAASARMKVLIDAVLVISRIGREPEAAQVLVLEPIIEDLIRSARPLIETRNASVEISGTLPPVFAGPRTIEKVFGDLIVNGIKFNRSAVPRLEIGASTNEAGETVFFVRDNGIGIAAEFHDKVFAIFQRLHRREEFEGTGAGLTVVKRAVEALGGRIWIESNADAGVTFRFTLPLASSAEVEDTNNS